LTMPSKPIATSKPPNSDVNRRKSNVRFTSTPDVA
jgi:hypothetical protein